MLEVMHERVLALRRVAQLFHFGLLDVSRSPLAPVSAADYMTLAMLCTTSEELLGLPCDGLPATTLIY